MKKFLLAFIALAAAFAITPSAMADSWQYKIDGTNFTSNLILYTNGNGAIQTVTDVSGTFDILGNSAVTFGETPTVYAHGATAYNLADNGAFLFDNLLYPSSSGNQILDWGGFLVQIGSYQLNIFGGYFGGSDGTYAPGNTYFYFADNGNYHSNIAIPDPKNEGEGPATFVDNTVTLTLVNNAETPEPGSLLLLGTGLVGLALILFRKEGKRPAHQVLGA